MECHEGINKLSKADKPECRVLQVFDSLAMGGAETWLMALLKYFQECSEELPMTVRTDILLTGGEKAIFDAAAESFGAHIYYLNFTRKNSLSFMHEFRRILAQGRYQAIHDHQDYAAGLRFMMALGNLPPVRVAHVHNTPFQLERYNSTPLRRLTFHMAKRFLRRTATHVTSTSRKVLGEFGFDEDMFKDVNRQVVNCGFDVSDFQGDRTMLHHQVRNEFGWGDETKVMLFVGRLDDPAGPNLHRKRPDFALEVARACMAENPRVRMIMAGSGEQMRRKLEAQVKGWGLEDRIRLTGIYPDITRLMLGSDLFLFPSMVEGLGMVVVEAQAAGLRVLTSDGVPRESVVIPEIVEFKSLDEDLSVWAKAALRLLEQPAPDSQACNLAVRDSTFSIQNSARKLLQIYCGNGNMAGLSS